MILEVRLSHAFGEFRPQFQGQSYFAKHKSAISLGPPGSPQARSTLAATLPTAIQIPDGTRKRPNLQSVPIAPTNGDL